MRIVILLSLVLLAASIAWRYRAVLLQPLEPGAPPPRPIVFDNGSVREPALPPPPSGPPMATTAPGAPRKCVRGGETTYTNVACPPGFKEAAIRADAVTVLPAAPGSKPPPAPGGTPAAPSALHEALDMKRDDELRRRVMERAIDGK